MQCPLCINESLEPMIRGEVEIDVCPRCRGVWLDRGEIDKLSGSKQSDKDSSRRNDKKRRDDGDDEKRREDKKRRDDKKRREDKKRRKKSFADKIADVFDDILD